MTNCKLSKDMGLQIDANFEALQAIPFQNVIRNLMYTKVCTRPDIPQPVGGCEVVYG
jgi:hypothetical protein